MVRWERQAPGRGLGVESGPCGKVKVRCGACSNRASVALDDRERLVRLHGQVLGSIRQYRRTRVGCSRSASPGVARPTRERSGTRVGRLALTRQTNARARATTRMSPFSARGRCRASDHRRLGFAILTRRHTTPPRARYRAIQPSLHRDQQRAALLARSSPGRKGPAPGGTSAARMPPPPLPPGQLGKLCNSGIWVVIGTTEITNVTTLTTRK